MDNHYIVTRKAVEIALAALTYYVSSGKVSNESREDAKDIFNALMWSDTIEIED